MIKLPPRLLPGRHDLFSGFELFVALLFLCKNEYRYEAYAGCAEQTVPDRQIHCIAGLRSVQLLPLGDVGSVAGHFFGDCGLPACEDVALAGRLPAVELRRCFAAEQTLVDLILEDLFTLYTVRVGDGVFRFLVVGNTVAVGGKRNGDQTQYENDRQEQSQNSFLHYFKILYKIMDVAFFGDLWYAQGRKEE